MKDAAAGTDIIMYGVLVGKTDNERCGGQPGIYRKSETCFGHTIIGMRAISWTPPDISKFKDINFNGYHRHDGRVGTANYWLFIPTVFCENRNLDVIREVLQDELGYSVTEKYKSFTRELILARQEGKNLTDPEISSFAATHSRSRVFKNVDGIRFLNHEGGCGGIRQDSAILGKLLAAYANHPNVGGITILSLGCQHLQSGELLEDIKNSNPGFDKPVYIFEQQQSQSEEQLNPGSDPKNF